MSSNIIIGLLAIYIFRSIVYEYLFIKVICIKPIYQNDVLIQISRKNF